MQVPLSIFIICKNEEDVIETTLKQAAKLADEIVIVDSGSTDRTLEICKNYTDKIFHQDWLGFGKQKNIALEKCTYDWVFNLDADEVITDDLIEEIKAQSFTIDDKGYLIARKLFIGLDEVRHGGFYPDYQLRIFQKNKARFCSSPVHESVELKDHFGNYSKSRTGLTMLKNPLCHYAYQDISELEATFQKYASLSVRKKSSIKAVFSAVYVFFYKFFIRAGFLDGLLGLKLAIINAKYNFKKYS